MRWAWASLRRDPHPDRDHGRVQGRQEARDAAQVLPRLHPGRDGDVRRRLARGEEHAQGDRLRRHRASNPTPLSAGRGRPDPRAGGDGQGEAEAEVRVREGRAGQDHRRPVQQLHRRGGRGQPRPQHAQGHGHDLRPADAGRARFPRRSRSSRSAKGLGALAHGEESRIGTDQAADSGRAGDAGASGGPGARPGRRQHHGLLQDVQRPHRRRRRADHPGGDHGLRRPQLHLHHQDAAGGDPAA